MLPGLSEKCYGAVKDEKFGNSIIINEDLKNVEVPFLEKRGYILR